MTGVRWGNGWRYYEIESCGVEADLADLGGNPARDSSGPIRAEGESSQHVIRDILHGD